MLYVDGMGWLSQVIGLLRAPLVLTKKNNELQVWNTVEVEQMIHDNSSGFGWMKGIVADESGGM